MASPASADPPDYLRDVRPLLMARCAECHGAEEQESGLRLDHAAGILAGGNSGPAIVPGKGAESLLLRAVLGSGDASKMPPEGPELSASEIDLLKSWIDAGALAPDEAPVIAARRSSDHWSFQSIVTPAVPAVQAALRVRNPIDAFVLARLEQSGATLAAEADRATLIRRLSLDLLGLPPSPEEIEAYLSDASPDAYERLVERLLNSPHYGERWGRHWLDLARYADSNGYTIDGGRSIWKYRDWVIQALNRDLPFDQFTIEQLAGDMLPDATVDQRIATGFHRNTLINEEGGTDPEQFRVEAVVDRVSTTGTVFLGLTLGCARCHDHKYDPISQREFYQVFALLNNTDEPLLPVPSDQQSREEQPLLADIVQAEKRLADVDSNSGSRQSEWERSILSRLDVAWTPLPIDQAASAGGAALEKLEDGSWLVSGSIPDQDVYTLSSNVPLEAVTAIRLEALSDDRLPRRGPGLADNGLFMLAEFTAALTSPTADAAAPVSVPAAIAAALSDYSGEGGAVALAIDGKPETGWHTAGPQENTDRAATFLLKDDLRAPAGARLSISLTQQHVEPRRLIGRFRLSVTSAGRDVLKLSPAVRQALATATESRTPEQIELLKQEYRLIDPERLPLAARIAELKERHRQLASAVTSTMILTERSQPRVTNIHLRGDFLRPGASVSPNTPEVLPPLVPAGERANRLDFARWLVTADNPLTPRVTVNRLWQQYFGQGLVATENDFGLQGERPSHPELLDWLANEFVARGWSLKAVHRLIVESNAYRQASRPRAELAQVDPYNRLIGRQARLRLEAETIRDSALAASGLLSRELGGPGVYPPQPEGIYRFTQQVKYWTESQGADRYRRGMYTYFWRSSPYPFLKTFDAPDANTACTRRPRANTPLQALTLANDRAFFEIARGLAARTLAEGAGSTVANASGDLVSAEAVDQARLRYAFRLCLTREPSERELSRLNEYLTAQRTHFASHPADAALVASQAASANSESSATTVAELAAWTAVARVLFNLDEFITRE